MQNENQPPTAPTKKFRNLLVTGTLLLVVGIIFFKEANVPATERSWIGHKFEALIFACPVMVVLGAVMLLLGVFRYFGRFVNSGSVISPGQASRFGKAWRMFIWLVAGLTIFPWWWLDILTRLNGGRPGNEGEGLLGTLITMMLGMPSLALAVFTEFHFRRNHEKKK